MSASEIKADRFAIGGFVNAHTNILLCNFAMNWLRRSLRDITCKSLAIGLCRAGVDRLGYPPNERVQGHFRGDDARRVFRPSKPARFSARCEIAVTAVSSSVRNLVLTGEVSARAYNAGPVSCATVSRVSPCAGARLLAGDIAQAFRDLVAAPVCQHGCRGPR